MKKRKRMLKNRVLKMKNRLKTDIPVGFSKRLSPVDLRKKVEFFSSKQIKLGERVKTQETQESGNEKKE